MSNWEEAEAQERAGNFAYQKKEEEFMALFRQVQSTVEEIKMTPLWDWEDNKEGLMEKVQQALDALEKFKA